MNAHSPVTAADRPRRTTKEKAAKTFAQKHQAYLAVYAAADQVVKACGEAEAAWWEVDKRWNAASPDERALMMAEHEACRLAYDLAEEAQLPAWKAVERPLNAVLGHPTLVAAEIAIKHSILESEGSSGQAKYGLMVVEATLRALDPDWEPTPAAKVTGQQTVGALADKIMALPTCPFADAEAIRDWVDREEPSDAQRWDALIAFYRDQSDFSLQSFGLALAARREDGASLEEVLAELQGLQARSAWEAAVAAHETAKADERRAAEAARASSRAFWDTTPDEIASETLNYGRRLRWFDVSDLDADITLTAERKDQLRPLLVKWIARDGAQSNSPEKDALDQAADEADDRRCLARAALLDTPAPDLEAMIYKQRVAAIETDDDGFGFADLGDVAYALRHNDAQGAFANQHLDTLRLMGVDDPVLHLKGFNPYAWKDVFTREGGFVSEQGDALILATPNGTASVGEQALLDVLAADPWKYRAVYLVAKASRSSGGDPYLDAHGNTGEKDGRLYAKGLSVPVRAGLRVSFGSRDGAPFPMVEVIDNREQAPVSAPVLMAAE